MKKILRKIFGIQSPSTTLVNRIEIETTQEIDHEAIQEAVEQARKREIWERQTLPLGR